MTKNKSKPLLVLASGLLCTGLLHAQDSANASGGDASGSGGSAAYSIGQVVYTTHTGNNGSVAQGVQQPYEISVVLSIKHPAEIHLIMKAYPNPTTDVLILSIKGATTEDLSYQLYDMAGRLIENQRITDPEMQIQMGSLNDAVYHLKVVNSSQEIKTFKIIKKTN
ncbi:T9SS type A sorting domain-containing protein [Flavobacterium sp. MFBS3-15]|uniref:T9SS type A sorting domain-containing protein n=1 Tax=Flavobacterium sp. MFBS3-15 TaxID=2989816 RepID=UPI002235B109|nr:T9SS type A sorting domain-containing protein [Flavobacterium sp. MFBS3-15]MCW4470043.1 T9SS type A sorting domain-containing protein [Flavobacterium sp. MFBS3-15]